MRISTGIIRRTIIFRAWIVLSMLMNAVTPQNVPSGISPCEFESLVKQILNPNPQSQMHANALRNQLRNMFESDNFEGLQNLDMESEDYIDEDKRSVGALARSGILPSYGKRYLGALARSGLMARSGDEGIKRSLATLAKNGQLPTVEPETEQEESSDSGSIDTKLLGSSIPSTWNSKRNLGSLAKSGDISNGKRNIGTLARDYQLPNGKRNLASLARVGLVPKRNLASFARLNSMYQAEKRNIGALKNSPVHGRKKREIYDDLGDYELPDEVIQSYSMDYDDLKNSLNRFYGGPYEEKRFLGSLAKNGGFHSPGKRNIGSLARLGLLRSEYSGFDSRRGRNSYRQQEQKRHIGALARSGWLPAFRPVRSARFSRSGRARSRTGGFYPQQERLRQPIAAVCRRCDQQEQNQNVHSWSTPGASSWSTPPRLTALHWRSLRPTTGKYNF